MPLPPEGDGIFAARRLLLDASDLTHASSKKLPVLMDKALAAFF